MGYFWILKLGLKCIDLLAWPLLALGYPLYASIQAIENDSNSDTKNLISYWILLSLICLFEYAFMKLLEWFLLWPYFKLSMICWLVIPNFRRSFLVYRDFVHPCISINPQGIINRMENWKKFFVKKDNFLLQAEKYIKENGTEALEKLISSKNMTPNLDKEITAVPATGKEERQQNMAHSIEEEAVKAVPAIEKIQKKHMEQNLMHSLDAETLKEIPAAEKKQLPLTSGKSLHIEQRYIKVIEKKEVPADKNANPIAPNIALNESQSSGALDADRNAGKDHIEQRYIKVEKREVPADNNANLTAPNLALNETKSSSVALVDANRMAGKGVELPHSVASKKMQKEWTCAVCQVTTTSEETLNIHVHGRKHMAALEALRWKPKIQHVNKEQKNPQIPIATQPGSEPEKIILPDAVNQIRVTDQQNNGKVHPPANTTEQLNAKNLNGEFANGLKGFIIVDQKKTQWQQRNTGKPVAAGIDDTGLRCSLCNVVCTSEGDMASHLNGKKHLAHVESSSGSPLVQDLWLVKGHC